MGPARLGEASGVRRFLSAETARSLQTSLGRFARLGLVATAATGAVAVAVAKGAVSTGALADVAVAGSTAGSTVVHVRSAISRLAMDALRTPSRAQQALSHARDAAEWTGLTRALKLDGKVHVSRKMALSEDVTSLCGSFAAAVHAGLRAFRIVQISCRLYGSKVPRADPPEPREPRAIRALQSTAPLPCGLCECASEAFFAAVQGKKKGPSRGQKRGFKSFGLRSGCRSYPHRFLQSCVWTRETRCARA